MTTTRRLLAMWEMSRTRLTRLLPEMDEGTLERRLHPHANSVGFLLRHIGEVDRLFARNVFGADIRVKALTLGIQPSERDMGSAEELQAYLEESASLLRQAILEQGDEEWDSTVTTAEFGTVTRHEALARNLSHTAYHAGQVALIVKYSTGGSPEE